MYVTTVETTSCSEYMRMTMEMLGRDFDSKSMVLNAQKNKNVVLLLDHTNLRSEDTRGLPPLQELELFGRILVFKDFASEA
ncbi:hypothetical protein FBU59_001668 [Linderina macrospora]|uniref:Uncharacterized protein n=1 Tax=Linderina macrospora TaxID=4868 RepID=A0ACC1JDK6_9FUNG|nr:hypothetical protein FBU59_001668 [Linderina macrospora]